MPTRELAGYDLAGLSFVHQDDGLEQAWNGRGSYAGGEYTCIRSSLCAMSIGVLEYCVSEWKLTM